MKARYKLLYIYIFLFFSSQFLSGQSCIVNDTIPVLDLDTTYISLVIESAQFDDLSAPDQGVELVEVAFEYLKITDLRVNLVSPAGQKVQLIGPTLPFSGSTQGTRWDVDFLRSGLPASPNADFSDKWDNLNDWLGQLYQGAYYPYDGELDDFNTGTVTGIWQLEIIDEIETGPDFNPATGEPFSFFTKFMIAFRKNQDVNCLSCDAASSVVNNSDIDGCIGSDGLEFSLDYNLSDNVSGYEYGQVVYGADNSYYEFEANTAIDLTALSAGTYRVCGLHYYTEIDSLIENNTYNGLVEDIASRKVCAKFSDNCMQVIIRDQQSIETESVVICPGSSYEYEGETYSTEGTYEIRTNISQYCDSISNLKIEINDFGVSVGQSAILLSCDNPTLTLRPIGLSSGVNYTWSTQNGGTIVDELPNGSIEVSSAGQYILFLEDGMCEETITTNVEANSSFNRLSVTGDTLYCIDDEVTLNLVFDGTIESYLWTSDGSQLFVADGQNIKVKEGGVYTVNVTNTAGCEFVASYTVVDLREDISLSDESVSLDCDNQTEVVSILGLNPDGDYNITWSFNSSTVGKTDTLLVTEGGTYVVSIRNRETSCLTRLEMNVMSTVPTYTIVFNEPRITCLQTKDTIEYIGLPFGIVSQEWLKSNGTVVGTDPTLEVSSGGTYTLRYTTQEGCVFEEKIKVVDERNKKKLNLDDVEKTCFDNPPLIASPDPDLIYVWTLPDGTTFTGIPDASFIGTYTVKATSISTGCVLTGSLEVINKIDNIGIPDIKFDVEQYTCSNITPTIKTDQSTSNYTFLWGGPNILTNINQSQITVGTPGIYTLELTNAANAGCSAKYAVNVDVDTTRTLELEADVLNCIRDTAQIRVVSDYTFDNIFWGGLPGILDPMAAEPIVRLPGTYTSVYTIHENGCMGSTSIEVMEETSFPDISDVAVSKDTIQCDDEVIITMNPGIPEDKISSIVWDGPEFSKETMTSVKATQAGIYTVTVNGLGSCVDTASVRIYADTLPPDITIEQIGQFRCDNEVIKLLPDANSVYESISWRNHNAIISIEGDTVIVSKPNRFYADVTGDNNCVAEINYKVPDDRVYADYTKLQDSTLTCDKTTISIGIEAERQDYKVTWTRPDDSNTETGYTIDVSTTGQYLLSILSEQDCITEDTITVQIDTIAPQFALEVSNQIDCAHESATIQVVNPESDYEYQWQEVPVSGSSAEVFEQGIYSVIGTGENGCMAERSETVSIDTTHISIENIYGDELSCRMLAFLHVETDLEVESYLWTYPEGHQSEDESPILQNGGIHTVQVTGANGCTTDGSIMIGDDRLFPVVEARDIHLRCDGAPSLFLLDTISENSQLVWEGLDVDFFEKGEGVGTTIGGTYEVIATNEAGCEVRDTFFVSDEEVYPEFDVSAGLLYCNGAQLNAINASDDEYIEWRGPNGFLAFTENPIAQEIGEYELIVRGIFGCTDTLRTTVNDGREYPEIEVAQEGDYQCLVTEVELSALVSNIVEDRLSYEWTSVDGNIKGDTTSKTIIATELGLYSVTVFDSFTSCESEQTFTLEETPQNFSGIKSHASDPTCEEYNNGSIFIDEFLGDFPPFSTVVNGYNYGEVNEINFLEPGIYYIEVVDSLGCMVTDTVEIKEGSNPIIVMPNDTTVYYGDTITIAPKLNRENSEIDSLFWSGISSPADSLVQVVEITSNTQVTLYIMDENGCETEASYFIYVREDENPFPNVFSPRGSEGNTIFYIPNNPAFEEILEFKILDNWGGLVYENNSPIIGDPTSGWDGSLNGQMAEQGVYVLLVRARLKGGVERQYLTTLTLLK